MKKLFIIIGVSALLLTVSTAIYLANTKSPSGQNDSPSTSAETSFDEVDGVTEERPEENTPPVNTGAPPPEYATAILGLPDMTKLIYKNVGRPGNIAADIKDAISTYGDVRLNKKFKSLTVIPMSVSIKSATIAGSIRLGETDEIVAFTATITQNPVNARAITVINKDGNSHGGNFIFIGGLDDTSRESYTRTAPPNTVIKQTTFKSPDLSITTDDKEAALTFISSLGYKIPDFNITFTNYENPFK